MAIKVGISLIAWQNDDLPELTKDYTTEGAMEDAAKIGYQGVERGRRMPAGTEELRAYLDRYGVALCGGWCSGNLMVNSIADEKAAIRQQVEQFAALSAPCIVYAECSNTIQGNQTQPVSQRPKLSRDEVKAYAAKLSELAKWTVDQGTGLSYHHHMGSPRRTLPASRPTTLDRPSTVSANVSTKPKSSATSASSGAKNSSTMEQTVPPTTDDVIAMESARPASSRAAMALPSTAVSRAEAVPGTLIMMAGMAPPAAAPQ